MPSFTVGQVQSPVADAEVDPATGEEISASSSYKPCKISADEALIGTYSPKGNTSPFSEKAVLLYNSNC